MRTVARYREWNDLQSRSEMQWIQGTHWIIDLIDTSASAINFLLVKVGHAYKEYNDCILELSSAVAGLPPSQERILIYSGTDKKFEEIDQKVIWNGQRMRTI